VIRRINQTFVCTTISADDVSRMAYQGNAEAREVFSHWEVPLVLAFFSPEGKFITKLTSLKELNRVHPDTTCRPEAPQIHSLTSDVDNAGVFLGHVDRYFPARP
jgi:hypothetical protein